MEPNNDYTILDHPNVSQYLFHPRAESPHRPSAPNRSDMMIPVADGVAIGASLHLADEAGPVLMFFHGNGEIVADYDDLAGMFTRLGINFFVADYRGYGRSTGSPTVSAMMSDCHKILAYLKKVMAQNGLTGPLCLMGRSLGSASVLELAAHADHGASCLIIESGFAWAGPLLRLLGIDPDAIGFQEKGGFENIDKAARVSMPCLVIHAQYDHIIPFSDGQALYDACPSQTKELLEIKGANHNDIFIRGVTPYLAAVEKFCFGRV